MIEEKVVYSESEIDYLNRMRNEIRIEEYRRVFKNPQEEYGL